MKEVGRTQAVQNLAALGKEENACACGGLVEHTVLQRKGNGRVSGRLLHARPRESSFHVRYTYVTNPYACNSSKHTGGDICLKNKIAGRKENKAGVARLFVHSWRTRKKPGSQA